MKENLPKSGIILAIDDLKLTPFLRSLYIMQKGRVVERGNPRRLFDEENSKFRKILRNFDVIEEYLERFFSGDSLKKGQSSEIEDSIRLNIGSESEDSNMEGGVRNNTKPRKSRFGELSVAVLQREETLSIEDGEVMVDGKIYDIDELNVLDKTERRR